ncbi:hypothetical protein ACLKA6_010027 [Drosophila palustris]
MRKGAAETQLETANGTLEHKDEHEDKNVAHPEGSPGRSKRCTVEIEVYAIDTTLISMAQCPGLKASRHLPLHAKVGNISYKKEMEKKVYCSTPDHLSVGQENEPEVVY